ncbi:hypothetical protein ABL78_4056 [Leptomonas seymouri]|uniref:Uncharacterized protein n=1 Tax=Leptomonas seymouri TaxID=5684 RepID=A0A0N0P5U3_LEPSE|nr:hypothetical protein ABL78_4056 [Leptomonas seymouri]|eukprot:KPI86866.1 hypothetical protein ABL78_4056 [Leptomonas seymouri]
MDDIAPPVLSTPQYCLHLAASRADLGRDYGVGEGCPHLRLPVSILPPTVPLLLFAVRPRELFSVAANQRIAVIIQTKNAPPPQMLQGRSKRQQNWTFMRLRFPFLASILCYAWKRLSCGLRNTERALCASLVQDGAMVREPGTLYTTECVLSIFLSYMAQVHGVQSSRGIGEQLGIAFNPSS